MSLDWIPQCEQVYRPFVVRSLPQIALAVSLLPIALTNSSRAYASDVKHSIALDANRARSSEAHLKLGEAYEQTKQFDKAEAEYVIAAVDGSPEMQTQALSSLQRILQLTANHDLDVARGYENKEEWSQAEAYFIKAAESAQNQPDRQVAFDGIERTRKKLTSALDPLLEETQWLPKAGTLLLRILAPIVLFFAIVRFGTALRTVSKSTKIWQFEGDDGLSKLIQSGFPSVRAKAFSVLGYFNDIKLPQTVSNVFPFVPLHLDDYFPDEAVEVGDLKIPSLTSLLRLLVRPRLEIEGGILPSDSTSFVYAHVWWNRWFRNSLQTTVTATIPKLDLNGAALELFIYDVYLKTWRALDNDERS